MPKGGLPGYTTPGDVISTVLADYQPPRPTPPGSLGQLGGVESLPELLCTIRRRCEGVEGIDLEKGFREAGGRPGETKSTHGTIDVRLTQRANAHRGIIFRAPDKLQAIE